MPRKKSVLFVCLGNICRSPTGEAVLNFHIQQQALEDFIFVESAGTIGYHEGKPADSRMKKHAARRSYDLTSRSRKIKAEDFDRFDLIIAMDQQNREDIMTTQPNAKQVRMLSDFLDDEWPRDVPDPYYGGEEGFEVVLDMIEVACPKILEAVTAME